MAVLELRLHPQRGRGLYTTRHVQGGETVLVEAPTLLTVPTAMSSMVCASCLRCVKDQVLQKCQGCGAASFCSPQCQQHANSTSWVHGPAVCCVYKGLAAYSNPQTSIVLEEQDVDAGRFLAHAMLLKVQSGTDHDAATRWASLQGLQGQATDVELRIAQTLMPVLQAAAQGSNLPLTIQEMADLLRKEQLNSYGILAPTWFTQLQQGMRGSSRPAGAGQGDTEDAETDDGWHRLLRGSAVYAWASLINHECNPNVARFDNFDLPGPNNTHVAFRAMHDLPKGTEVFQSYFPVSWDYEERQEHLQHVYGFTCNCQRCQLEKSWSPHIHDIEEEGNMQQGEEDSEGWETDDGLDGDMVVEQETAAIQQAAGMSTSAISPQGMDQANPYIQQCNTTLPIQPQEADPGPLDPTYLQLYLLKYVCSVPDCYGTLAPQALGSQQYECCVCGTQRTEAQFLAELEA